MSDLLERIDAAVDGLCPCGAAPRAGSAYCGPDCEPTHIAEDTDAPGSGTPTPMRWRPDLVTAADETDLIPLGSETHGYTGRFNAQVYERASDPTVWHLRLDDGNLFVGCDLGDVGGRQDPISIELVGRVREAWQRLERKLTDTRDKVPADDDPWGDVLPDLQLLHLARRRRPAHRHISYHWSSYHNPPAHVAAHAAAGVEAALRVAARRIPDVTAALVSLLRQTGVGLSNWQRTMLEQMTHVTVITPRRTGRSPAGQWLSDEVWAALNQPVPTTQRERRAPPANPDELPADPMLRAIEAKRNRNTGPPKDRLDGRRRR